MDSRDPALEGIDLADDFPSISLNEILRFRDFCRLYPNIFTSESAGRALIFNSASNGLDEHQAVLRIGKAVYIVVPRLKAWLLGHVPDRMQHPTPSLKSARANVSRLHNANKTQRGDRHGR